jgi:peptidyl-prolyl cis-trans isomerase D
MLDSLRASKGGLITWIFLGAIIVVFVISFGPGSFSKGGAGCGGTPAYAARVNGVVVPVRDFEEQANRLSQFFAQFGQDVTGPAAVEIRKRALDAVIERALVIQEAQRRGLVVTDAEISAEVRQMPQFQENGQFRFDLYEDLVKRSYGSPARFEAALREQLLYDRMLAALDETVKVSDAQAKAAWRAMADKVTLTYVRFPLTAAQAEVNPSDADVKAFAGAHAAEIDAFYKANPDRFDQKKKARVRQILVRVAPGAQSADDAAARAKIEAAQARVKKGEDFGKVAREVSEDPNTKDRGGEVGFVSEATFDEAFAKAALALEKGQVSDPVRTAAGWHLIQSEEVVPARQVSLDAARPEIARELLAKERAGKLLREKAQAALDAARKGKPLAEQFPKTDKQVKIGGAPVVAEDAGPFAPSAASLPGVGAVPALAAAAAAASTGEVLPQVYDTPAGPVIAVVKLRERPDDSAFEAQRGQLTAQLRRQKEGEARVAWLQELRSGSRVEENRALLGVASAAQPE